MSTQVYYEENMSKILSSCCSLQNLKMEGLRITSKMAASICLNGTTLQVLNLSHSFVDDVLFDRLNHLVPNSDLLKPGLWIIIHSKMTCSHYESFSI